MSRRLIGAGIVVVSLMILFGLLFAGAMKVREAAYRTKCVGDMYGLATQLLKHVTATEAPHFFPRGTVPNDDLPPEHRLSWYVWVVPSYQSEEVFELKAGAADDRNRAAIERRIRHFICPNSEESSRPLTHFVGIAGIGTDAATLPTGHPRAGAFGYDRQISFDDGFVDGTSNTLMLAETSLNPGHWAFGGPATVRGIDPSGQYIGPGKQFGGFHPYRHSPVEKRHFANVVMADGSYHSISSKIAPDVFEALATAVGREQLPVEWWSQH